MEVPLLTIAIWIVAIYSLRLAILGNPTVELVRSTPALVLNRALESLEEGEMPDDYDLRVFLRELYRLKLVRGAVFFLETLCIFYLLIADPTFLVTWFLAVKSTYMYYTIYHVYRESGGDSFQAVLDTPGWVLRWDRISQLITGVCFLLLMMRTQGVI